MIDLSLTGDMFMDPFRYGLVINFRELGGGAVSGFPGNPSGGFPQKRDGNSRAG
jgi:hypothetical protein